MTAQEKLNDVVASIRKREYRYGNERGLHDQISAGLREDGLTPIDEVRLNARDRIDVMCGNGIGVEIKVGGRSGDVARQIERYLAHDRVQGVVLVTSRASHFALAEAFSESEKPVEVVDLLWL